MSTILTKYYKKAKKQIIIRQRIISSQKPLWNEPHLQPVFCGFPKYRNGISGSLFKKGLCLPDGSNLLHLQKEKVVLIIKNSSMVQLN